MKIKVLLFLAATSALSVMTGWLLGRILAIVIKDLLS